MSSAKKLVNTYAKSLFQTVNQSKATPSENFDIAQLTSPETKKGFLPNIYILGEELSLLRSTIVSSENLKDFFKNPTYPESLKLEFLVSLFPGTSLLLKSFLKVLTERSHLSLLPEIYDEYNRFLLAFQKSTQVKIITPSILQESYGVSLLKTLKSLTSSTEVTLNLSYNPKLLGGLILEYNSSSIDASILKEFSLFFNEV
jgi:F-type H+-transporting ATPase subunit delta